MTTGLRLVSRYEWATVNVLRANAYRWLPEHEIVVLVQAYQQHCPPRTVRHYLAKFVDQRLAEHVDRIEPFRDPFWRWNPSAPVQLVDALEWACDAEGFFLEPVVADPPTHCALGHDLAVYGDIFPDGSRFCVRCQRFV